jgi:GWxTD domain-containing protein
MIVTDDDSKKKYRVVQNISIRDFTKQSVTISDPMFISKITEVEGRKMIVPNVSNNVGNIEDEFYTFFEIYSSNKIDDSIQIKYTMFDKGEDVVYTGSINHYIDDHVTSCFLALDKKDLIFGNYVLQLELISDKYKDILPKQPLKKMFLIRWQDLPISVNNLDLAIRQTSYIASPSEVSKMESGKTQKEKLENFLTFWKNRKPSMEEYFARVDYANEKFKSRRDGWKTDMGMVFIIFGNPDYVERHPFELDSKPYEMWDYYAVNRRFYFVDETGFGDYRSVYPIWDNTVREN